jgi:hypothetical protein
MTGEALVLPTHAEVLEVTFIHHSNICLAGQVYPNNVTWLRPYFVV